MSGSRPENTVTDASEQVHTLSVITSSGISASMLPLKKIATMSRYPVCENTPMANTKSTSGATRASRVVTTQKMKSESRVVTSCKNHGTIPKNRYQMMSTRGSSWAMGVSSLP